MRFADASLVMVQGARSRPVGRFLLVLLVLLALGAGLFGARLVASRGGPSAVNPFQPHPAPATVGSRVPTSSAIESSWGIRFTAVNLIADGGMVELRYEVVDAMKGGRIHRSKTLGDLPTLIAEPGGQKVTSHDLMFHIHRGVTAHDEGRAFSIVYGNANYALRPGTFATIKMSDGLTLQHFPVTV
jgi:hypothetical protein